MRECKCTQEEASHSTYVDNCTEQRVHILVKSPSYQSVLDTSSWCLFGWVTVNIGKGEWYSTWNSRMYTSQKRFINVELTCKLVPIKIFSTFLNFTFYLIKLFTNFCSGLKTIEKLKNLYSQNCINLYVYCMLTK